jgi:hypothetical protein
VSFIDLFRKTKMFHVEHPVPEIMNGMAERNAARMEAIKRDMGDKWILHPNHKKSRLQEPRPV